MTEGLFRDISLGVRTMHSPHVSQAGSCTFRCGQGRDQPAAAKRKALEMSRGAPYLKRSRRWQFEFASYIDYGVIDPRHGEQPSHRLVARHLVPAGDRTDMRP
jgi:hypothetical protein